MKIAIYSRYNFEPCALVLSEHNAADVLEQMDAAPLDTWVSLIFGFVGVEPFYMLFKKQEGRWLDEHGFQRMDEDILDIGKCLLEHGYFVKFKLS